MAVTGNSFSFLGKRAHVRWSHDPVASFLTPHLVIGAQSPRLAFSAKRWLQMVVVAAGIPLFPLEGQSTNAVTVTPGNHTQVFIHLFIIQQIFPEHLLCARCCSRHWGCSCECHTKSLLPAGPTQRHLWR